MSSLIKSKNNKIQELKPYRVKFKPVIDEPIIAELMRTNCKNVLNYIPSGELKKYGNQKYGIKSSDPVEICTQIHDKLPSPVKTIRGPLKSSNIIFKPGFFVYVYYPDSFERDKSKGNKSNRNNGNRNNGNEEKGINKSNKYNLKHSENGKEWQKALENYDTEESWFKRIQQAFKTLNETETGQTILQLVATLFSPGEITITNLNPHRLSANILNFTINIPSVPRFICYYDKYNNLITSSLSDGTRS